MFRLNVGRIGVALAAPGRSAASWDQARRRYRDFLVEHKAEYRFELASEPRPAAARISQTSRSVITPSVTLRGRTLTCKSSQLGWELDLASGMGRGRLVDTAQNFDSLLRTLYGSLLARKDGALLHSAALARRGAAHLFVGESGAGKTTFFRAASALPGVTGLSDELAALKREKKNFRVYATPFWGEFRPPRRGGDAPLGKIFFLARAPKNSKASEIVPLSAAEAQRRLLKCLVSFESSPDALGASWDLILDAVRVHPAAELRWRKSDAIDSLIGRLWT